MKTDHSLEEEVILTAEKFASRHIAPVSADVDHSDPAFPSDAFARGLEAGFDKLILPEDQGGSGLGMIELCALIRTLAGICAGHAMVFGVQAVALNALTAAHVWKKNRFSGDEPDSRSPIAVVLPEPMSLEDFISDFSVVAGKDKDFKVSGNGLAVNAAPGSRVLIFAKDADGLPLALLVDNPRPEFKTPEPALGLRAMPMAEFRLDSLRIPREDVAGEGDVALEIMRRLFLGLCLVTSAAASGTMSSACKKAFAYAAERYQGGRMIIDHTHLRSILGGMSAKARSSEATIAYAAAHPEDNLLALSAMTSVTRCGVSVCTDAVQVLGGYGYMRDFGLEKMMRDMAVLSLLPASGDRVDLLIAFLEKARLS